MIGFFWRHILEKKCRMLRILLPVKFVTSLEKRSDPREKLAKAARDKDVQVLSVCDAVWNRLGVSVL
jgi:hypothetical protein